MIGEESHGTGRPTGVSRSPTPARAPPENTLLGVLKERPWVKPDNTREHELALDETLEIKYPDGCLRVFYRCLPHQRIKLKVMIEREVID